ncbi:MAG: glycosyltransferase family 2 protein, partial [Armatimonadetes bacterium]|nr:glycosyltransferase family 2 protein [Armatimonadota bacterium]
MTLDQPSFSVVVPLFNNESSIGRALESVLGQNPPPTEVIVVDDGSTDAGGSVVTGYGDSVRLVRKENGGPGSARNEGMKLTSGELVAFLDADDYWLPGFTAATTSFLVSNPEVGAVSTA